MLKGQFFVSFSPGNCLPRFVFTAYRNVSHGLCAVGSKLGFGLKAFTNFCLDARFVPWHRKRAKICLYYLINPCSSHFRLLFNTQISQQWPRVFVESIKTMVVRVFCAEMTQIAKAKVSSHYFLSITHKKSQAYIRVLKIFQSEL